MREICLHLEEAINEFASAEDVLTYRGVKIDRFTINSIENQLSRTNSDTAEEAVRVDHKLLDKLT